MILKQTLRRIIRQSTRCPEDGDAVSRILAASWNREGIYLRRMSSQEICIAVNRFHRFRSRPWGANIPLRKVFLSATRQPTGLRTRPKF